MEWAIVLWILSIVLVSAFVFASVFNLITAIDLEGGEIRPEEACQRVNFIVYPEYVTHFFLTILFLLSFNWFTFILNAPLALNNLRLIFQRRHLLDETRVLQGDVLSKRRKYELIKMIFFLMSFFFYLYKLISTAMETTGRRRKRGGMHRN